MVAIIHLETEGHPSVWKTHKKFLREIIESEGLHKRLFRDEFKGEGLTVTYEDTRDKHLYSGREGIHVEIIVPREIYNNPTQTLLRLEERLYLAALSTYEKGDHKCARHIYKRIIEEPEGEK